MLCGVQLVYKKVLTYMLCVYETVRCVKCSYECWGYTQRQMTSVCRCYSLVRVIRKYFCCFSVRSRKYGYFCFDFAALLSHNIYFFICCQSISVSNLCLT